MSYPLTSLIWMWPLLLACEAELAQPVKSPDAGSNLALQAKLLAGPQRGDDRILSVLLTDGQARPLEADPQGFSAFVAGEPVKSTAAMLTDGAQGVSIVVVVDESVAGRSLLAVRRLVSALRPPYEIEILRVATEIRVVTEFGDGGDGSAGAATGDERRILDAAARAVDDLAPRDTALRLIWVITGGCDIGSAATPDAVAQAALLHGVRVVATGTTDATPDWLRGFADDWRYDPDPLGFAGASVETADLIGSIWQIAVTVPRDAVVDLRFVGEGIAYEFTDPTQK